MKTAFLGLGRSAVRWAALLEYPERGVQRRGVCIESGCRTQNRSATQHAPLGRGQIRPIRPCSGRLGLRVAGRWALPLPAWEGRGGARAATPRPSSRAGDAPGGRRPAPGAGRKEGGAGRARAGGARGQRRQEEVRRLASGGPGGGEIRGVRCAHPLWIELQLRGRRRQQQWRRQRRQRLPDGSSIFAAAPPAPIAAATNNNIRRRHSRHVTRPRAKNRHPPSPPAASSTSNPSPPSRPSLRGGASGATGTAP